MHKKLFVTATALAIVGTTLLTAQHAFAQTSDTTQNPMSSLVNKISTKFGLNKAEVQAVFDEEHQAREAEMKQREEQRLSQLVTDGKITEAQKQLILSKRQELMAERQSERENFQKMTEEERRATMEKHSKALQEWAQANGIDPQYLQPMGPKGRGMGGRMFTTERPDAPTMPTE